MIYHEGFFISLKLRQRFIDMTSQFLTLSSGSNRKLNIKTKFKSQEIRVSPYTIVHTQFTRTTCSVCQ